MDRKQAIALLKALVASDLIEPSWVSIKGKKPNDFQLQIKCDYNKKEIEEYAKTQGLTIEEEEEKRYLVIFKL